MNSLETTCVCRAMVGYANPNETDGGGGNHDQRIVCEKHGRPPALQRSLAVKGGFLIPSKA